MRLRPCETANLLAFPMQLHQVGEACMLLEDLQIKQLRLNSCQAQRVQMQRAGMLH